MLASMLAKARAGEILGCAVVMLHYGRDFSLDISGSAHDDHPRVRGLLRELDDLLKTIPPKSA